jgi:hypothetical protein
MRTHTRKEDMSSSHLAPQKTKHPSRLTEWTLSGSPRLFTDKLFILNNLSVKPHLFTDKLSILSQLFTVIRFMVASQTASQRKKTKHPSRLAEVSEAEQWRQIHILPRSQTVRKVLARLKYSVPIYKARSGFSILTEEYLTFQTVSPSVNLPYIRITSKAASVKLFTILTNKDGGAHYENNFQDKRMEEMLRRW